MFYTDSAVQAASRALLIFFFFFANNYGFNYLWNANVQADLPKCASLPATGEAQKREYWWTSNLVGFGLCIIIISHVLVANLVLLEHE